MGVASRFNACAANSLDRPRAIRTVLRAESAAELTLLESIDVGKPLAEVELEIQGTIDTYRYFAGWASKLSDRSGEPASLDGNYVAYTRKEPVGVIVPWNFPLQTLAWKLGAALAVGCMTVVKPPEVTSLTTLRFAELVDEAGLPNGVVNVLTGKASTVGGAQPWRLIRASTR